MNDNRGTYYAALFNYKKNGCYPEVTGGGAGLNLYNCMGYEDCVALKPMFLAIFIPILAYFLF